MDKKQKEAEIFDQKESEDGSQKQKNVAKVDKVGDNEKLSHP